jgi:CRP/FNR family cyclic AMP-dependent transcriptional regulator
MEKMPLDVEAILPAILQSRLGKNLRESELRTFFSYCELQRFEPGETIIQEGDLNHDFFVVVRNAVIVEIHSETTGQVSYVDTLSEGEIVGEAALFVKAPRTANIRAADDADVLVLNRPRFFEFLSAHPKVGIKILFMIIYSLLGRLRAANEELAFERRLDTGQDDIDDLVAQFLPNSDLDDAFAAQASKEE